jgi:cell division control protein 45
VASRLRVWTYRGPQKLQELLAKMGLPLRNCKESWALMSSSIKQQLDEKLTHCGASYELPELQFPSFVRNFGYKLEVCAEDVVYAVTALLELNNHETLNDELVRLEDRASCDADAQATGSSAADGDASATTSSTTASLPSSGAGTINSAAYGASRSNFWIAYEALDSRTKDLTRGFELAKDLQKAIVHQGAALLEKKALRKEAHYRRCVLDHSHTVRQWYVVDGFATIERERVCVSVCMCECVYVYVCE